MKEDLVTLNERGLAPPVILGGAALNRRYVEEDLRAHLQGPAVLRRGRLRRACASWTNWPRGRSCERVGSAALKGVVAVGADAPDRRDATRSEPRARRGRAACRCGRTRRKSGRRCRRVRRRCRRHRTCRRRRSSGRGSRTDFDMDEVFGFLNELTLFSTQWQFRKGGVKPAEYARQIAEVARPALERLKALCLAENILRPAVAYGFFPRRERRHEAHRLRGRPHDAAADVRLPAAGLRRVTCACRDYVEPLRDGRAVDYVAFMAVTMGREVTQVAHGVVRGREVPGLPVPARPRASSRPRRWPSTSTSNCGREWGIGGDDSPRRAEAVQGALPRLPVLVRLPGVPEPGGPGRSCSS